MNIKKMLTAVVVFAALAICPSACRAAEQGREDPPASSAEEARRAELPVSAASSSPEETTGAETPVIYARVGATTLEILPESNSSAEAFIELLERGDLTVELRDYGGFEKVGALEKALPAEDARITAEPGDLILYQGNRITIYYEANTWSLTRLGRVQGMSPRALREALGEGDLTVTFSLSRDSMRRAASDTAEAGVFDFQSKTVLLNSGYTMPILGLGTYSLDHDTCVSSVMSLLASGGRLIDTAYMYHNEEAVGEGVRRAMAEYGIPREEIFVITKLYPNQFGDPEAAIDMALEKLDIGYIDMMLLHHPGTDDVQAYRAMERYAAQGKIHSLGLSNWYVKELTEFLPQVTVKPALVQNEIHPYYQEQDVVPFIQSQGIVVQCWYPLGGRGHTGELLGDETIRAIAASHGVSPAQVILRWDLQRGIVVIPGSGNPDHIRENLDLFGFELSEEEMEQLRALDRGEKHDWY